MRELEKPTSTWARMRSKHALNKVALTAVDVLDAGIRIQQRPAPNYQMLASCQQYLTRARWVEALRHRPRKDLPRAIIQHRMEIDFRSVEQLDERGIDVPDFVWLRSSNTDGGLGRVEALPWASPTMLAHKICPGAGGSKDLADSLGIASQGAERHVPMLGRQYHLLDVGHLDGREVARAGSRARGAIVQSADRRGGAVPSVVSPGFEMRDTQDHGEGEEWFCTGDGTQDFGFGAAFREPLASEGEAGSAEHRQENSDNGGENAHSAIKLCDGVHQLLAVLVERFDGDDRALTTSSPGRNSGARDPDVLGQAYRS